MIFLPYNLYSFINFKEKMFKRLIFIILFSFLRLNSWAQDSPTANYNTSIFPKFLQNASIQTLPAFYLNTWTVDVDYPISKSFTVGVSYATTLGKSMGGKQHYVIDQDYTDDGMRLQLSGNYFFMKKAPQGLYAHAQVSYNTIVYYDGTTRPFSLHSHRKDIFAISNGDLISKAKKMDMGVGVGYQAIIIPKHIIANILLGIQGNKTAENDLFINVYIRPTIGFIF